LGIVGITAISVPLGLTTLMLEGNWLARGENILAISTIPQKMLPVKDAKVKGIKSRTSNAKLDLVQERKA